MQKNRATRSFDWRVFFLIGSLVITLPVVVGCDQGPVTERPSLHPVSGRVTVSGKPVAGVIVTLHAPVQQGTEKFLPSATSREDGSFRVGTFAAADGAPEGEYVVTCIWPKAASADATEIDQLRGRYSGAARSKIKITVRPGPNELPPLSLQ